MGLDNKIYLLCSQFGLEIIQALKIHVNCQTEIWAGYHSYKCRLQEMLQATNIKIHENLQLKIIGFFGKHNIAWHVAP